MSGPLLRTAAEDCRPDLPLIEDCAESHSEQKNLCCVVTGHGNMLGPGHSMKTGANGNLIGAAARSLPGKSEDLRLASCRSLPSFGSLYRTTYEGFACLP